MSTSTHHETKLQWKWVILSVVAGLIIVGASYFIVAPTFHSREVQALVMLVGFVVAGAIIGYFSPGITINEATVGGALVMAIMLLTLYLTKAEIEFSPTINLLLLILGVAFSWVGGWAGEKLQGDPNNPEEITIKFQWKWAIVGVIIGFALNVLVVFLLSALFPPHIFKFAFFGFVISFIVTGFIVGYKSPGVTIKEPALAGVLSVVLDWIFLNFMIKLHVPTTFLIVGLALGFLLAFFGAWFGEWYQASTQKKSPSA
jgi:hypothetical protein